MGKKYRISVSGKTYEVEVEEVDGSSVQTQNMARTAPAPQPVVSSVSTPAPATSPKVQPEAPSGQSDLTAPIPGNVFKIHAKVGDTVKAGDLLLVIEAMKMENEISAEADGVISDIPVKEGDNIAGGDVLVRFE